MKWNKATVKKDDAVVERKTVEEQKNMRWRGRIRRWRIRRWK